MRLRSITIKDQARFMDSMTNAMTAMGTNRDLSKTIGAMVEVDDGDEVENLHDGAAHG